MFRDDVEVALNRVLVLCEANARRFRYTAELLEHEQAAQLLHRLAGERDALATEVRHQLQRHGELPDTVDVERQSLQEFKDMVIANLTRDGHNAVLLERVEDEEHLASAAAAALDLPMAEENRPLIERVRKEAESGAEYLRATCDEAET